jgi:hypothetical protein
MPATISLSELQCLSALKTFISGVVSSALFEGSITDTALTVTQVWSGELSIGQTITDAGNTIQPKTKITKAPPYLNGGTGVYTVNIPQTTNPLIIQGVVEIVRGQDNRVPEPLAGDFIVMTPIMRQRLAWNAVGFFDGAFTVVISGNIMTVTEINHNVPTLVPGVSIRDTGGVIFPNTIIGQQISGPPGGLGEYFISPSQATYTSVIAYAGLREDMAATKWTVQLDVHGPLSGDNIQAIYSLFFSEYATNVFSSTGFDVTPLTSTQPRQIPFLNAEQQIEYRWSIDLDMQINPIVSTPQQFFDEVEVSITEVDTPKGPAEPNPPPVIPLA